MLLSGLFMQQGQLRLAFCCPTSVVFPMSPLPDGGYICPQLSTLVCHCCLYINKSALIFSAPVFPGALQGSEISPCQEPQWEKAEECGLYPRVWGSVYELEYTVPK